MFTQWFLVSLYMLIVATLSSSSTLIFLARNVTMSIIKGIWLHFISIFFFLLVSPHSISALTWLDMIHIRPLSLSNPTYYHPKPMKCCFESHFIQFNGDNGNLFFIFFLEDYGWIRKFWHSQKQMAGCFIQEFVNQSHRKLMQLLLKINLFNCLPIWRSDFQFHSFLFNCVGFFFLHFIQWLLFRAMELWLFGTFSRLYYLEWL